MDKKEIIDFNEYTHTDSEITDETETELLENSESDNKSKLVPYAIYAFRAKMLIAAAAFAVGGFGLAYALKSYTPLFFILPAMYFVYNSYHIVRRYNMGFIREIPALCSAIKVNPMSKNATATFVTVPETGENPEFFRFTNISKRMAEQFVEQYPYIVYFDIADPHTLIGHEDISSYRQND